jgi:alpha-amylase/alpha-mannosidase (GH57 family)
MNRFVCIHGHFYQPPRENPWLERIELQDSAYPYHDWNERITAECYRPNQASRILDMEGRIIDIVSNYSRISFDFGPTLLSWMEKNTPEVYRSILEADGESQKRFSGHGSALGQVYNHMIMPLANNRDKRTQVLWGIKDFEHRFKRNPEGIWLAETAVDLETLEVLAGEGIIFTILAPRQAHRVREIGSEQWIDVRENRIDPTMPYRCRLPSGKEITLFFYDGPVSQELAYGTLLMNGENLAHKLMGAFRENEKQPQLVHIATDGETYGHHQRHGDMALAFCLHHLEANNLAQVSVYGEYLERHAPTHEVDIFEGSSWSCIHGVERWRADCGCNSGMHQGWNQSFRKPLREAMDWLRDAITPLYEKEMAAYAHDPWAVRDGYIEVIMDRSPDTVEDFFARNARRQLSQEEQVTMLKLLEVQRHAMFMYTSCGWFFDEVSGIETVQVMQYAARAIQLTREVTGEDLEPGYVRMLAAANSNLPELKNGAQVFERYVKPATIDLQRVGAHYAISSLFEEFSETAHIYCFSVQREAYEKTEAGKLKLAIGRVLVRSDIIGDENTLSFSVLHLGDHNLMGGVREYGGEKAFLRMKREIKQAFIKSDIPEIIRLMDRHFGMHNYSLWHLFRDQQRKVFNQVLSAALDGIESSFWQMYENNYPIMQAMREMNVPIPKAFTVTVEFILNRDLRALLEKDDPDREQMKKIVEELRRWSCELDKTTFNFIASQSINRLVEKLSGSPEDSALMSCISAVLDTLMMIPLELDLWEAQNMFFSIGRMLGETMHTRADRGDQAAKEWLAHFAAIGKHLKIRIA